MTSSKRLPYPGLRAFTRDESDLFFGRDGCVDAMVDRLAATRFLAVLGASGSGKSSLVRTGLLDALSLGFHPWAGSRWRIADLHPGGQPIRNLAAALLSAKDGVAPEAMPIDLLAAFLRRGPRSVAEWTSGGNLESGCNLLILVDQFEELFRYGNYAKQEEAEAFVNLLLETADITSGKIHVVVTMRSEFLGACALMRGLAEKINAGLYLTPRMTRDECQEAIEGPAGVTGFTVERPLVNRLLNDLASFAPWEAGESVDQAERLARRADQLPLMQHVLNRLWARACADAGGAGVVLRLADYDGLGGLSGALDAHGEEVLSALGSERARRVEAVFRSLVSGSGVATAVRRPCRLGELVEVAGNRDDVVGIVGAFRAPDCNFLRTSEQALSNDDVIVDISHESLIRPWTPLRGWLENEARASAAWQRLVAAEERHRKGEGGLLSGLDLSGLAAWWKSAAPTPAWAERHGGRFEAVQTFLETSQRAEAAQADAERRRQIRERNRLWVGIAGLAVALAFAVGFGVVAHLTSQKFAAVNRQLETANTKLMSESQMRLQAENGVRTQLAEAEKQRDVANKARNEAETANQKAQQMFRLAREKETQLTAASSLIHSAQFTELSEMRSEFDKIIVQSVQKDIRLTQASNLIQQDRSKGLAEGDNSQEVAAARKRFALEANAENLASLRLAANALYDEQVKLKRQREADALQKELSADAEKVIVKAPGAAAFRVAWDIYTSQGDLLKSSDPSAARKDFARSLELAELLPADNTSDLYKSLVSYERQGDQESRDGRAEMARAWYTKEVATARKIYALEASAETLGSLKIASDRLYEILVKLGPQPDADSIDRELVDNAEKLVDKTPGAAAYRVARDILGDHGDRLKSSDPAGARKAYSRSVDLGELLPADSVSDLYSRVYSCERLGDLETADGRMENARAWYTKEVDAARLRYALETIAENLQSFRIAVNRLYEAQVKLNHPREAEALRKELDDDAEKLVRKTPGAPAYRIAWLIFTDRGDRLKLSDPAAARKAFTRGLELAELLPADNAPDLYRRLVSYERRGDLESADGRTETARSWYAKEVDAARKRYALETIAEDLAPFRVSVKRLCETLVKLNRQPEADTLQKSLLDTAVTLLTHSQTDKALSEVILAYSGSADLVTSAGDLAQARRYLIRAEELALKLTSDTPDGVYARYESVSAVADSLAKAEAPAEARAAYLQASLSLEAYLGFVTGSPPRRATADASSLAGDYGSLSWRYLLAGNFSKSIDAAQKGLELEPDAAWIEANLAHALLLSGKQPEAIDHYMKICKRRQGERSILDVTAEDFGTLKRLGFVHPAMDDILKKMEQE